MKKLRKSLLFCVAALASSGLAGCDFFTKPLDFNENPTPQKEEQQQQPVDETIHVESLSLSASKLNLLVGSSEDLVATILPENATNKAVTFKSLDETIATVSDEGKVTGASAGTTNIVVQSVENGSKFQICSVTVKDAVVPVESVIIGESSVTLEKTKGTKLVASVFPEDATNKSLSWRSTNSDIVSVDQEGNILAKEIGSASIIVKSVDNPNADAIFNIKVEAEVIHVTGVEFTQTGYSLEENAEPIKITAHVLPYNPENPEAEASNKTLHWTSSDESVAVVAQDGTVTPKLKGTTTITATSPDTENGEFSASCTVEVRRTDIETFTLSDEAIAFAINSGNNTKQLTANIAPEESTYKEIVWSSTNPSVATVTSDGLKTATVTSHNLGSAIIVATHVYSGLTATCQVSVVDPGNLQIMDSGSGLVSYNKNYQQFIQNIKPKDAEHKLYEFSNLNEKYEVGDDNPVNFMPFFEVYEKIDNVTHVYDGSTWPYPFTIKVERKEGNAYVDANENEYEIVDRFKCDIDFSQQAADENNVYRITITLNGVVEEVPGELTVTYNDIKVVDGYNVTNEFELSYLDTTTETRHEQHIAPKTETNPWGHGQDKDYYINYPEFKKLHGLKTNYIPETLVLQKDLNLGVGNLPAEFFYDMGEAVEKEWTSEEKFNCVGSLKDYAYIYKQSRADGDPSSASLHQEDDFDVTLSGNYFTLDYSRIPLVKRTDGKKPEELVKTESHAKLFGLDTGTFTLKNLSMIGNASCARGEEETYLAGGLGGFDLHYYATELTATNILAHSCYMTFLNDEAAVPKKDKNGNYIDMTLTLNDCKLTDNYNCFIYNFGGDVVCNGCTFVGAGGPVIIQDHRIIDKDPDDGTNGLFDGFDANGNFVIYWFKPSVEFNDCDIRNYVYGEEAWFSSFAIAGQMIPLIKPLSDHLANGSADKLTFLFNENMEGRMSAGSTPDEIKAAGLMNFIVVNKGVAEDATQDTPVDGTVIFRENNNIIENFNYMNPVNRANNSEEEQERFEAEVGAYQTFRALQTSSNPAGRSLPIFQTEGGHAVFANSLFDINKMYENRATNGGLIPQSIANRSFFIGKNEDDEEDEYTRQYKHVGVYYSGMMMVFGAGYIPSSGD